MLPGPFPVDAAVIYSSGFRGAEDIHEPVDAHRQIEHLGEIVACSRRHNTKARSRIRTHESGNNLVNRSVSANGHDDVAARSGGRGYLRRLRSVLRVFEPTVDARCARGDLKRITFTPEAATAGAGIDDECKGLTLFKMHNGLTYARAILLLTLLITACRESDRLGTETVTDDLGRTIHVSLPANRVATLAPNLTEIVFAVGAGDRLVGVGTPDDFPPAVDTLPRYSTYPVDFEALAALEPHLVLATDQVNSPRSAETLDAVGIPTYFLSFASLNDVFDAMETVGRLLGTTAKARTAVDSLRGEVAAIRRQTDDVTEPPTVLFLIGPETLYSFGKPSYIHELVALAGGRSITQELGIAAPVISEEYVLTRAPDVIVGPWNDEIDASDLLEHHPTWDVVPAVRNQRVYGVPADLVERPGPRLVAGARLLARKLHPDLSFSANNESD